MGYKINRIMMRPGGVEKQVRPDLPPIPYLCFTANTAGSTVQLTQTGSPTAVNLETSMDGSNWSTYTIGSTITLSNIGDKVYWRNTSETPTGFSTSSSNYYQFAMSGSINASGDVDYLLCKNSTDTLIGNRCFYYLFFQCSSLKTPPKLTATTLTNYCYYGMFHSCSSLEDVPNLPATTLANYCYQYMFNSCTSLKSINKLDALTLSSSCYSQMYYGCSNIKLSTTQTGAYQTPYRIPTTGTGSVGTSSLYGMFDSTGGTFTGTPNINTTYYTSNTVI